MNIFLFTNKSYPYLDHETESTILQALAIFLASTIISNFLTITISFFKIYLPQI